MPDLHKTKMLLLSLLSRCPGTIGRKAETRRLRRLRAGAAPFALAEFQRKLAALRPESVCLDLGANVGDWTVRMAEHAGHVHAFEPDPWAFDRLADRVRGLKNVTLHNAAVGTSNGVAVMRRARDFSSDPAGLSVQTSVVKHTRFLETGETFEVQMVDLVSFLRQLDATVDIIKMDIEGSEIAVLEALLSAPERNHVGSMFVETHEVNMPELRPRLHQLRRRINAAGLDINLDWP